MFDVEVTGLDQAFLELENQITDAIRGLSVVAWNRTLEQTPQFFGRAVASWTYSVGAPVFVDRSAAAMKLVSYNPRHYNDDDEFAGRSKGDREAIGIANAANLGHDSDFRLGDTIYFANGADHGEGDYVADIERGEIGLRPVNQPGRMASRALDYVKARWGLGISPAAVAQLQTMRIG